MGKILFEGLSLEEFLALVREVVRHEISQAGSYNNQRNQDILLTREQTCDLLHITFPTFHRWCKQGKLKVHRAGGRVLVKKTDVEACLQAITTEKAHAPP